ncbi:hypothetical protein CHS0354_005163 [Potamilus streckersoni]|uniref:Uncharacterized protein n=1 Tax=Potamilus streckersoni TaxID=2493646 RepID=A0AAE0RUV4_9BIVA|nr:hypothetical protein CHS0354_005163 [Potamilus streckersoni]
MPGYRKRPISREYDYGSIEIGSVISIIGLPVSNATDIGSNQPCEFTPGETLGILKFTYRKTGRNVYVNGSLIYDTNTNRHRTVKSIQPPGNACVVKGNESPCRLV